MLAYIIPSRVVLCAISSGVTIKTPEGDPPWTISRKPRSRSRSQILLCCLPARPWPKPSPSPSLPMNQPPVRWWSLAVSAPRCNRRKSLNRIPTKSSIRSLPKTSANCRTVRSPRCCSVLPASPSTATWRVIQTASRSRVPACRCAG